VKQSTSNHILRYLLLSLLPHITFIYIGVSWSKLIIGRIPSHGISNVSTHPVPNSTFISLATIHNTRSDWAVASIFHFSQSRSHTHICHHPCWLFYCVLSILRPWLLPTIQCACVCIYNCMYVLTYMTHTLSHALRRCSSPLLKRATNVRVSGRFWKASLTISSVPHSLVYWMVTNHALFHYVWI